MWFVDFVRDWIKTTVLAVLMLLMFANFSEAQCGGKGRFFGGRSIFGIRGRIQDRRAGACGSSASASACGAGGCSTMEFIPAPPTYVPPAAPPKAPQALPKKAADLSPQSHVGDYCLSQADLATIVQMIAETRQLVQDLNSRVSALEQRQ